MPQGKHVIFVPSPCLSANTLKIKEIFLCLLHKIERFLYFELVDAG